MSGFDTFILFAAEYSDLSAAEEDYETVKAIYYDLDLVDTFDAAVIEKRPDGKVKIVKKHEEPLRVGAWVGGGLGLAVGAAIALFPAAAIGAGLSPERLPAGLRWALWPVTQQADSPAMTSGSWARHSTPVMQGSSSWPPSTCRGA
ncbi:MAG: hypothetical protein M5U19_15035 [Microthrixaceae bacterium]|nr:hypothetical protein [Microthrixaceae bacterium]